MCYVREAIKNMSGYVSGEQLEGTDIIKLNTNENPYPPSAKAVEAMREAAAKVCLYPEASSRIVREAAAKIYGVKPEQVMVANGSDETLRIICQACTESGDTIGAFYPTYSLYKTLAEIQGAKFVCAQLGDDFSLPADIPEEIANAKIVFLPNPNAPTGTLFPQEDIARLCESCSGLVVVDEAYADFAGVTATAMLKDYPNLVVSRTFSKSYSMAGLRVGLAIASEEILCEFSKVRDSYNVDRVAQAGAAAALLDDGYMKDNAAKVVATREKLCAGLAELGGEVVPSKANFVLVRFGESKAATLYEELKARNIFIRYFDAPRLEDCVRISVGTDAQTEKLLAEMKSILAGS